MQHHWHVLERFLTPLTPRLFAIIIVVVVDAGTVVVVTHISEYSTFLCCIIVVGVNLKTRCQRKCFSRWRTIAEYTRLQANINQQQLMERAHSTHTLVHIQLGHQTMN